MARVAPSSVAKRHSEGRDRDAADRARGRPRAGMRRHPRLRLAAALVLLVAVASCGSRREHAEFEAAAGARPGTAAPDAGGPVARGGETAQGPAPTVAGAPTRPGDALSPGVTRGAPTGREAPQTTSGDGAPAPPGGDRSPVVLGSVGNYSGPAGSSFTPPLKVLQAWVADVNARGGIEGRTVQLIVADDRSDPTRHRSALQDLVENHGVVAFVNWASLSAQGGAEYLERKRVPVIAGDGGNDVWWRSPMYFPFAADNAGVGYGSLAAAKLVTDSRKLGTLSCQESQGCKGITAWIREHAESEGFDLVYQGEGSIAAPDFTAQCLAARNAGVEVLFLAFDINSDKRVAQSCTRQGFRPIYIPIGSDTSLEELPEFDRSIGISVGFPFTYGGPETQGYLDVLRRYAPGLTLNLYTSQAWAAGKALEKIVGAIDGPVTSEAILEQLWRFDGETIDGMVAPMTFVRDEPAPPGKCTFAQVLRGGEWVPLTGMAPLCGG